MINCYGFWPIVTGILQIICFVLKSLFSGNDIVTEYQRMCEDKRRKVMAVIEKDLNQVTTILEKKWSKYKYFTIAEKQYGQKRNRIIHAYFRIREDILRAILERTSSHRRRIFTSMFSILTFYRWHSSLNGASASDNLWSLGRRERFFVVVFEHFDRDVFAIDVCNNVGFIKFIVAFRERYVGFYVRNWFWP